MCKTEEDAIQQDRKISIKQPAGSWSKPLECFRGRGIRYCSNNEPRLPDRMKIEEIQQQSELEKNPTNRLLEFKNNRLFALWIDKYAALAGCCSQWEGGLAVQERAAPLSPPAALLSRRAGQGWHGPQPGKAGHLECCLPGAAAASPAARICHRTLLPPVQSEWSIFLKDRGQKQ